MIQTSWLPVLCDRTKPPTVTADADCIAIHSATQNRYLCKSGIKFKYLPAIEWICAHLARDCGLPVPKWEIIEVIGRPDKMFGSLWEGGARDWTTAIHAVSNPEIFSRTLAFDNVVHNVDRHVNNYLYLEIAGDIVAKVIDSSRALLFNGWPLPPLPLPASCNTISNRNLLERYYPFDANASYLILNRIDVLPKKWMKIVLDNMPDEWMSNELKSALCAWWENGLAQRINDARGCLI